MATHTDGTPVGTKRDWVRVGTLIALGLTSLAVIWLAARQFGERPKGTLCRVQEQTAEGAQWWEMWCAGEFVLKYSAKPAAVIEVNVPTTFRKEVAFRDLVTFHEGFTFALSPEGPEYQFKGISAEYVVLWGKAECAERLAPLAEVAHVASLPFENTFLIVLDPRYEQVQALGTIKGVLEACYAECVDCEKDTP